MKLYVTRHGETAWNRENIVCGVTDIPLNETGMEQAKATAQKLRDTPLDRVIVSPLLRARQTAALISQGRDPNVHSGAGVHLFGGDGPGLSGGKRAGGVPRRHLPHYRKLLPQHDQPGVFSIQYGQLRGSGI